MSFILQSIFATYLIFGGLFGQEITGGKENGWVIMFLYAFPSFVAGILLTKFIIKKRKKLISTALLITGGVIMSLIGFVGENKIIIGVAIFISSFMFTSAYILNNAVFSDIGAKLKKESNHLFGMLNATGSMSYIVVPLLLGMISDLFGYYMAFSFMGLIAIVTGVALFVFTPKKIKISETELNHIK